MSPRFVTRFAPSPTGLLHLGHAFSAWQAHDAARAAGGTFLLRIEDIDFSRCRPEFEDAIYEDLSWIGISWEEPVVRQSENSAAYAARLDQLIARGLVYRCFKTRKEIADDIDPVINAPHGPIMPSAPPGSGPLSPDEEAAKLAEGIPFAWRLNGPALQAHFGSTPPLVKTEHEGSVQEQPVDPLALHGVILGRKDIGTSYHIAAVHDDAASGVTHVIRGLDLVDAAPLHAVLFALFDAPNPVFRHHRLIVDSTTGKRFAKRDKSVTLRALREAGATPMALRTRLGLI